MNQFFIWNDAYKYFVMLKLFQHRTRRTHTVYS